MSIYNPLGSFDHADPKKIQVPPVFPDKDQPQEIWFKNRKLRSEKIVELQFFLLLHKKIDDLLESTKNKFIVSDKDLGQILEQFKSLFQNLMMTDISQDYRYAEALSNNWHTLLEIIELLENAKLPHPCLGSLQLFVKKLFNYPQKRDHTMGYYLTEHTGEKWIPFPFMDILSKLHEDALIKKTKSTLHDWVLTLSKILTEIT